LGRTLKRKVTKFLWAASNATVESHRSVGLGIDIRPESRSLTGFALAHEEEIVHLSVFAKSNGAMKSATLRGCRDFLAEGEAAEVVSER